MNTADMVLKPSDCGFAQAAQHRIRSFDNDQAITDELRSMVPFMMSTRLFDYEANPRKSLVEATKNIFRKPEDGGLDHKRAMEGLGLLEAAERHRRRQVSSFKQQIAQGYPLINHNNMVHELDRTATSRYDNFHMGFRALVSTLLGKLHLFALVQKSLFVSD